MMRSKLMKLRIARFSNNVTVHFGDERTPDGILDGRASKLTETIGEAVAGGLADGP